MGYNYWNPYHYFRETGRTKDAVDDQPNEKQQTGVV